MMKQTVNTGNARYAQSIYDGENQKKKKAEENNIKKKKKQKENKFNFQKLKPVYDYNPD